VAAAFVDEPTFDPTRHSNRVVRFDLERLRAAKMLPPPSQERQIAAQFSVVKRPLIAYAQEAAQSNDVLKRTLMVASALPGDGKTFTTLNLAMSLALELDLRVLLIDADTPKRHLTQTLDLDREPGLLDVVAGHKPRIEELILPTDVPRLDILPIGTRSETSTELVASARMAEMVTKLATLYRRGIVLFDSPPILLTNEARTFASILGQVVLVVRAGVTPQRAVKDAVDALGEGRRISVVLNSADLDGATGYYYGHRYGYGYGEDAPLQPPGNA
jgi:exopolysaccharide/PEP-CTERM locus tyrosine autokinase